MPCCVVGPSRVVMMPCCVVGPSRVVMMPSRVVILRVLDARGSRPYGESDKNQDEGGQYSGSHSPGCHINKGSAQDLANSSLQYGNELIDPKVHEGPMEPSKTRTIQCVSGDGETRVTSTIGPERVPKPQSWCKNPAFSSYGIFRVAIWPPRRVPEQMYAGSQPSVRVRRRVSRRSFETVPSLRTLSFSEFCGVDGGSSDLCGVDLLGVVRIPVLSRKETKRASQPRYRGCRPLAPRPEKQNDYTSYAETASGA